MPSMNRDRSSRSLREGNKCLRPVRPWLGAVRSQLTGFDVSIASLRAVGTNSQHNNVFPRSGDLYSLLKCISESVSVADHMIGGEQSQYRIWILPRQDKCSQANCRSCIPTHR